MHVEKCLTSKFDGMFMLLIIKVLNQMPILAMLILMEDIWNPVLVSIEVLVITLHYLTKK